VSGSAIWTGILATLSFGTIFVQAALDWKEHPPGKRRRYVVFGVFGFAFLVASWGAAKETSDESADNAAKLATIQESVLKPGPRAVLKPGFSPPPSTHVADLLGTINVRRSSGSVSLPLSISNDSDVAAESLFVVVRIPDGLTYAQEPQNSKRVSGSPPEDRQFTKSVLMSHALQAPFTIEVTVPDQVHRFVLLADAKCANCAPSELTPLTVNVED
jgi:hypothetical protein